MRGQGAEPEPADAASPGDAAQPTAAAAGKHSPVELLLTPDSAVCLLIGSLPLRSEPAAGVSPQDSDGPRPRDRYEL